MSELEIYLWGVVTGVLALALIGGLVRWRKRRKSRKSRTKLGESHPLIRTLRH